MLSNYLKISIAVLLRRKFLTFVNLFGAVLTLTVLVVAFAIFESFVSPAGAQHRQGHMLVISRLRLTNSVTRQGWGSYLGPAFYRRYVATLETPDKISYASVPSAATSYVDGRKITSQIRRTDAVYFEILDFNVLDGRVLSEGDVDQGRSVAVINEATADRYFPDANGDVVGRRIAVGPESFDIVGVVANEPETSALAYADIWVPVTTAEGQQDAWLGDGWAMLYFDDPARRGAAADEYSEAVAGFEPIAQPADFDTATSEARTAFEIFAGRTLPASPGSGPPPVSAVVAFTGLATAIALLFMALPAINMANLNVGRILERAPEIGLRKAAGASTRVLIGQFIFENVVLCALGGLIAFAITPIVLGYLNDTVFAYGRLTLNMPVFAAGFGFILIFGVLSGAYPAWKMARLEPASALRGLQHA